MDESIALVELVEYIERCVYNWTRMFKLTDLSSLNVQRLEDIGIERRRSVVWQPKAQIFYNFSQRTFVKFATKGSYEKRDFSEHAEIVA